MKERVDYYQKNLAHRKKKARNNRFHIEALHANGTRMTQMTQIYTDKSCSYLKN